MGAPSSNYSEWNTDVKWSSQEWKTGEMLEARTVKPVSEQPASLFTQHTDKFVIDDDDMDSSTATESDLSLKSRSFAKDIEPIFKRCNARQQQTFFDMGNVHVFNIGSICIHGKELLRKFTFHQKCREQSHDEDISKKLIVGQSDEIYGVTPINWEDSSGNSYLWSVMKKSSVSRTRRFLYFHIMWYALER